MIEQAIAETVERTVARALAEAEERIVDRVVAEMARRWPEPDGWLTRKELAAQMQISIDTLDRRIADEDDETIEVQKIGRAVRCRLRPPIAKAEIKRLAAEARR